VQDRIVALLRIIGRVSNLSLLTIESYSYGYCILDKMVERNWRPGRDVVWVLVGVASYVPRPRDIIGLHYFPYPCQIRTVRCMDPGQVTDLLIPSIYWRMGARKTCYSLIMGSSSFGTD
jgi:hypothetical protein